MTRLAADVVLLGGSPAELRWLLTLARRTVRIARENLATPVEPEPGALKPAAIVAARS